MKVCITGANGRLGQELLRTRPSKHEVVPATRVDADICNEEQLQNFIRNINPNIIIHCAALTNPLKEHETNPEKSIRINIQGTANIAQVCLAQKIKLIYISTDYVYYGPGPHKEDEPLLPLGNYAISKLAGECITRMVPHSLILRCSFTERPFRHNSAFIDAKKSFIYLDEIGEKIWNVIEEKGIINIGGTTQSIYDFAKLSKPDIKPIHVSDIDEPIPYDTSLDLTKYDSIIRNTRN